MFDDVIYSSPDSGENDNLFYLGSPVLEVLSRRCRIVRLAASDVATESGLILRPSCGSRLYTGSLSIIA
jgi:hypothetical protein